MLYVYSMYISVIKKAQNLKNCATFSLSFYYKLESSVYSTQTGLYTHFDCTV